MVTNLNHYFRDLVQRKGEQVPGKKLAGGCNDFPDQNVADGHATQWTADSLPTT